MAPALLDKNRDYTNETDLDVVDPLLEQKVREVDASLALGNIMLQCGLVVYDDDMAELRARFLGKH